MASQYLYFVKHAVCLPWDPRASCQKWVLKGCSFDNKARNVTIYMTATNVTSRNSFEDFRPPSQLQVVFSSCSCSQTWGTQLLQPSDHCHWVYCWCALTFLWVQYLHPSLWYQSSHKWHRMDVRRMQKESDISCTYDVVMNGASDTLHWASSCLRNHCPPLTICMSRVAFLLCTVLSPKLPTHNSVRVHQLGGI